MQWTGRNPCTCADKCRVTGTFTACAAIVLSGKISLMKICFILVIFVVLTVIFIPSNKINYTILTLLLILFRFHCMLVLTIYNIHILYREFQWGGESPEVLSSPPSPNKNGITWRLLYGLWSMRHFFIKTIIAVFQFKHLL